MAALIVSAATLFVTAIPVWILVRDLRKRAAFKITPRVVREGGPTICRKPGSCADFVLGIGLKNTGKRAARDVLVNVVGPDWLSDFGWSQENGALSREEKASVATSERLTDAEGGEHQGLFLARVLPRVSLRHDYELFVRMRAEPNVESIPLRLRVNSDDLADSQPEYCLDYTVVVDREP